MSTTVLDRIKSDMQKLSAGWEVTKYGVLTPPERKKRIRVVTNTTTGYELCGIIRQDRAVYC